MSYLVKIVRTKSGQMIPIQWLETTRAAAGVSGVAVASDETKTLRVTTREVGKDGDYLLYFEEGEIWSKTPTEGVLGVMIALADKLDARVLGEEFESYRTPSDTYVHPDDRLASNVRLEESRKLVENTRKRQILINAMIFGVFVLLGLFVVAMSH